jgi:exopolyphosphatase/guanosine-5'-triphosphate,3'-diphosphate pyrophosphatase
VASPRRLAVIDLGSNSFRLVVFSAHDDWWRRTDEIYEPVRIGAGLEETGALQAKPMERALETLELFAHFCRATHIEEIHPVATSAIRDATNQAEFLKEAKARAGLDVRVLSREEEARYGYLAAVNSTTLSDGVALDIGGGSLQLTRVKDRESTDARSWRLGAVRMTERFLSSKKPSAKDLDALRAHVAKKLEDVEWLKGKRLVGVGGAVRNLAAAIMIEQGLPSYGVQGYRITRKSLDALVDRLADMPFADRRKVSGIKPERGDVILAGAVVVQSVMEAGGFKTIEATEAGLREGVFFSRRDPPVVDDVRAESVRNLAAQYDTDFAHAEHVARLALSLWDALGGDSEHRELIHSAGLLHDIGTAVDYDDHHRHSRYLVLNAGLPGFNPRETALIAQMCRYHRKGDPGLGELKPLASDGDEKLLLRAATVLRIAEQLERPRDQSVKAATVDARNGTVTLTLEADGDVSVSRWAALRQGDLFERAFDKALKIEAP